MRQQFAGRWAPVGQWHVALSKDAGLLWEFTNRYPPCQGWGRGFESLRPLQCRPRKSARFPDYTAYPNGPVSDALGQNMRRTPAIDWAPVGQSVHGIPPPTPPAGSPASSRSNAARATREPPRAPPPAPPAAEWPTRLPRGSPHLAAPAMGADHPARPCHRAARCPPRAPHGE